MQAALGLKHEGHFRRAYLLPELEKLGDRVEPRRGACRGITNNEVTPLEAAGSE